MVPKGQLLIIGGHEDKGDAPGESLNIYNKKAPKSHFEILGSLIRKTPRSQKFIEIIASASAIPQEMEEMYINSERKSRV